MKTNTTEKLTIAITFLICLFGALSINTDLCPDEFGRILISDYIYKTGKLPTGNEPDTIISNWQFSYALRPYLASIVGAYCMRIASLFTHSQRILMAMSRMCSVLSITGCSYFSIKAGNILFKDRRSSILLAVLISYLPQVAFLGMYQNNDALSLMAVSMEVFFLLKGYSDDWSIKSCVGIGISMAIGMLSYYSIYPWILLGGIFCIISCIQNENIHNKFIFIVSRSALVIAVVLILSGWFFIRNAIEHNGDFLGIASEVVSREAARAQGATMVEYSPGRLLFSSFKDFFHYWLLSSSLSFVGCFGYMDIFLSKTQYYIYGLLIGTLEIWVMSKALLEKGATKMATLIQALLLTGSIATMVLSIYASYYRDLQAQGRYIITAILPISFAIAYGIDRYTGRTARIVLTCAWLGMFIWVFLGTMSTMFI